MLLAHIKIPLFTRLKGHLLDKIYFERGGERAILQNLKGFVGGIMNTIVPRLGLKNMNADQPDKILADLDFTHEYDGELGNSLLFLGINLSLMEDILQKIYTGDTLGAMAWMSALSEIPDANLKVFSLVFLSCSYTILHELEDYDQPISETLNKLLEFDWLFNQDVNCDPFWTLLLKEVFLSDTDTVEFELFGLVEAFWISTGRTSKSLLITQIVHVCKEIFSMYYSFERTYNDEIDVRDFVSFTMFSLREAHANALLGKFMNQEDEDGSNS
jgi:hypothetical protein